MTSRLLTLAAAAGLTGVFSLPIAPAQDAPPVGAPPDGSQPSDDFEVYNRGPLHEAFATPGTNEPVQGPVVNQEPPEPIDEVPPEQKPEGDNVEWIPGYWAYDEELDDFLWISGVWRDLPPGRTWVPGYWRETGRNWQWVAGMWAEADVEQVVYLPEPPESQERGPVSPSPGEGYFWVPGSWEYYDTGYRWRPGYWAPHQRDWIWVPACYHHTPRGYVYVPGYWDYLLAYRGVAFAPVYFHNHYYGRPFAPTVALGSWGNLMLHLFVHPTYGRYYFGDYYGPRFGDFGYTPFYAFHRSYGYDPLFVYFSWRFGGDYYNRLDGWHRYFATHEDYRPRRTFREQREFFERNRDNRVVAATSVAATLEDVVQSRELPVAFTRVSDEQRQRFTEQARDLQEFTHERHQVEVEPDDSGQPGDPDRPGLRIKGNERLHLRTENGRAQRERIEAPERPDQLRDVRPDDRDGGRARVPSPHTRERGEDRDQPPRREGERPDVREQPDQPGAREHPGRRPDQPDRREQPGGRERTDEGRQPDRRGPRDLPRLPDGAPGGERGDRPERGPTAPDRGEPPQGQQPERGERGPQTPPDRGASDRGQGGRDRGERSEQGRGERGETSDRGRSERERPERGSQGDRPQRGGPR